MLRLNYLCLFIVISNAQTVAFAQSKDDTETVDSKKALSGLANSVREENKFQIWRRIFESRFGTGIEGMGLRMVIRNRLIQWEEIKEVASKATEGPSLVPADGRETVKAPITSDDLLLNPDKFGPYVRSIQKIRGAVDTSKRWKDNPSQMRASWNQSITDYKDLINASRDSRYLYPEDRLAVDIIDAVAAVAMKQKDIGLVGKVLRYVIADKVGIANQLAAQGRLSQIDFDEQVSRTIWDLANKDPIVRDQVLNPILRAHNAAAVGEPVQAMLLIHSDVTRALKEAASREKDEKIKVRIQNVVSKIESLLARANDISKKHQLSDEELEAIKKQWFEVGKELALQETRGGNKSSSDEIYRYQIQAWSDASTALSNAFLLAGDSQTAKTIELASGRIFASLDAFDRIAKLEAAGKFFEADLTRAANIANIILTLGQLFFGGAPNDSSSAILGQLRELQKDIDTLGRNLHQSFMQVQVLLKSVIDDLDQNRKLTTETIRKAEALIRSASAISEKTDSIYAKLVEQEQARENESVKNAIRMSVMHASYFNSDLTDEEFKKSLLLFANFSLNAAERTSLPPSKDLLRSSMRQALTGNPESSLELFLGSAQERGYTLRTPSRPLGNRPLWSICTDQYLAMALMYPAQYARVVKRTKGVPGLADQILVAGETMRANVETIRQSQDAAHSTNVGGFLDLFRSYFAKLKLVKERSEARRIQLLDIPIGKTAGLRGVDPVFLTDQSAHQTPEMPKQIGFSSDIFADDKEPAPWMALVTTHTTPKNIYDLVPNSFKNAMLLGLGRVDFSIDFFSGAVDVMQGNAEPSRNFLAVIRATFQGAGPEVPSAAIFRRSYLFTTTKADRDKFDFSAEGQVSYARHVWDKYVVPTFYKESTPLFAAPKGNEAKAFFDHWVATYPGTYVWSNRGKADTRVPNGRVKRLTEAMNGSFASESILNGVISKALVAGRVHVANTLLRELDSSGNEIWDGAKRAEEEALLIRGLLRIGWKDHYDGSPFAKQIFAEDLGIPGLSAFSSPFSRSLQMVEDPDLSSDIDALLKDLEKHKAALTDLPKYGPGRRWGRTGLPGGQITVDKRLVTEPFPDGHDLGLATVMTHFIDPVANRPIYLSRDTSEKRVDELQAWIVLLENALRYRDFEFTTEALATAKKYLTRLRWEVQEIVLIGWAKNIAREAKTTILTKEFQNRVDVDSGYVNELLARLEKQSALITEDEIIFLKLAAIYHVIFKDFLADKRVSDRSIDLSETMLKQFIQAAK